MPWARCPGRVWLGRWLPEAGAPVRAPLGPSDFGVIPEACPQYELSLRGNMGVLIDEPDFYGVLDLGATLRARLPLPGGGWVSASVPGFAYKFVANATVEADSAYLSASTIGLHVPVHVSSIFSMAPYVRWMLPTETIVELYKLQSQAVRVATDKQRGDAYIEMKWAADALLKAYNAVVPEAKRKTVRDL